MKHIHRVLFILLGGISLLSSAQENNPSEVEAKYPIKLSGYIKSEGYWDTRQVVGFRDDQVLYYPDKIVLDSDCQDINAKGQFETVAFQTRMRTDIFGPPVKHAQSKGVIEFDFYGKAGISNIIRLRLAFLELIWDKVTLLGGQNWHPFYPLQAYARTISFNSGSPIDSYSRNPQFRVTWKASSNLDLLFAACSELDFPSDGPDGLLTKYMRDAVVPMLDFVIKPHFGEHNFGLGVEYKRIVPRLKTDTGLKARESLNSVSAMAYAALNWSSISIWTKAIFVQNDTDQNMIGGYGIHCIDEINDRREYTNLNNASWWIDVAITKSKQVIPGFFMGVIKTLGARETILPNVVDSEGNITEKRIYGIGTDIDTVFRISPRLQWRVNNFMLGIELEYTRAAYGTIDDCGKVYDTNPVGNTRLLGALFYYF